MPITISATDAGFHFLDAVGQDIAPDAFLISRLNPTGALFQTRDGQTWHSEESFLNPSVTVSVNLAREAALPPGARAGDETQLALSGLTFSRSDGQDTSIIGEVTFDDILTVNAVFDPRGSAAIGGGSRPNWIAEFGNTMASAAEADGFIFNGSASRDVFNPHASNLPLSATGEIRGFGGDDDLIAQNGGASIYGGTGNDVISARGGANTAFGGKGADYINFEQLADDQRAFGGQGRDTVDGGLGDDLIKGGTARDVLSGGAGDDRIIGGTGADRIFGETGADALFGGGGRDLLKGGFGADTLAGGFGDDKLRGGRGEDVFVFIKNGGFDVVTDFALGEDLLRFDMRNFDPTTVTIEATDKGALLTVSGQGVSILLKSVDTTALEGADFIL